MLSTSFNIILQFMTRYFKWIFYLGLTKYWKETRKNHTSISAIRIQHEIYTMQTPTHSILYHNQAAPATMAYY
jgi:hypothetical protein